MGDGRWAISDGQCAEGGLGLVRERGQLRMTDGPWAVCERQWAMVMGDDDGR